MQQEVNLHQPIPSRPISLGSLRERVGISIEGSDPLDALSRIHEVEHAGIQKVWMTTGGAGASFADILTLFATAVTQTNHIKLGTAIAYTYTRHPLIMAQQALVVQALAPGRLQLGVGPGNRVAIENLYGLSQTAPLPYLKEYVELLRSVLWEGKADYHGTFFHVNDLGVMARVVAGLPATANIPLLVSAVGPKAFRLAGQVADGALSWMCPIPYLQASAMPALRAGAEDHQRSVPPIVANVMVALNTDEAAVLAAVRQRIQMYAQFSAYAKMFTKAGWTFTEETTEEDLNALARTMMISGDQTTVRNRVEALLENGLDELLLQLVPIADEAHEREELLQIIGSLPA